MVLVRTLTNRDNLFFTGVTATAASALSAVGTRLSWARAEPPPPPSSSSSRRMRTALAESLADEANRSAAQPLLSPSQRSVLVQVLLRWLSATPASFDGPAPFSKGARLATKQVCWGARANTIYAPCGHVVACLECTARLRRLCCPVCQANVSDVIQLFTT
ncbi:hypothetical protein EMIHUDRAFT_229124 [Emiliania huxleyi CCMP1516]|uniref:RING-type domain-containing protein n=2 Tax=Emiliania huxleyi TaxID=2903 RepID=A0A0D3IFN1_EMIH1|nr:hypothetical protein EMIHUDRAFT_216240 [Emiliania huxleyi CCMP1516]XP_005786266.1 hypothetical protein EMIHUDRAFT_229124 [Emiliania huxleyi CCMP1516]EOD10066.1 hypothetical protein EMIHUDRAFT_216240 [Emiliania huxleyi CCMP1516]EOD33837.1 hypothetical protein EMIHUDRAFT_229124 [Emiliania huxleyi CCMP1516]|eukprot:XP_005762495.1 hypothetical protein EMIHUDRAFT_216240 [Emiliania huxleyi CCMP1516]